MAVVSGDLSDVQWQSMGGFMPRILFHPRSISGTVRVHGNRLLPSGPGEATITGTTWSIDLVPTVGMRPESWYELEVQYLDSAGNFSHSDWLALRLNITGAGGSLGDLPAVPFTADHVWVSLSPPPAGWQGWWLHSAPGDPDDISASGTGQLRAWRTV